jgi:regulator of RNase E activity RraA
MAEAPAPAITVIEDLDWPDCIGAFWGEVNTTVHKGLGIDGVLTNGVMRDLGDLAPQFQVLAGSIGPSHGFVHVVDFDQPVRVFGLTVHPGEFVHADRHGAVVVPEDVLPQLVEAIAKMRASEELILAPAREPGFDFEAFEKAWTAFEKARV